MKNLFEGISTLTELKAQYRKLAFMFHPDHGGDLEQMKVLNNEYDRLFNILKNDYNAKAKEQGTYETHEMPEQYREIILSLMELEGIEIELIGAWLWITGDTKTHKDILKSLGCLWAPKKLMWYWRPEEFKTHSRKNTSIDDIRNKYGSEKIVNNTKSLK